MPDFLFDEFLASPPDRGEVVGAPAIVVLLDAVPDPSVVTVGDLDGEVDRETTTYLASAGRTWAASLATQPTLSGSDAVGVVVGLGGDDTAMCCRWVGFDEPTSDPVSAPAGDVWSVTDQEAAGGLDATGASAGEVPTADGSDDWSWQPQSSGGGDPWPDGGGPHAVGSSGLHTVMDRQRVWIVGSGPDMTPIQVAGAASAPHMLGVVHADHRPAGLPMLWARHDDGAGGWLILAVDGDGTALGTPGGLWSIADGLDDNDTARVLAETVSWLVLPD